MMMRGRDGSQKKHLLPSLCVAFLFFVFLFLYYGSYLSNRGHHANNALEYGSKISRSIGWISENNAELGKSEDQIFAQNDEEEISIPKSFPVSVISSEC